MTIDTTSPAPGELERFIPDYGDLGMEDINASELAVPRLEILHEDGRFQNKNTKEEFDTLDAIFLGVVKQRIMWDKVVDDGDKPQCRSTDFELGWPQMRTDIPEDKQFPWKKANFDASDFPPRDNGLIALPCEKCVFKDWNTEHSKTPLCSEQFAFPLMYRGTEGELTPAILTLKKSAAKECKRYITGFKSRRRPMFTVNTSVTLTLQSRGKVTYSVPDFRQGHPTDRAQWDEYAELYRGIREFLRQHPRGEEDKEDGGEAKPAKPMATAKTATRLDEKDPWATAAEPAKPEDDDLPF